MWYINEFHLQILALELVFCEGLPRRKWFWLRLLPLAAVYLLLPGLVPGGFMSPMLRLGDWFTYSFLVMILLSALLLWVCFIMTGKQLVFCCCLAHTVQHMVHCLSRVIWFLFSTGQVESQVIELVIMVIALGLLLWFLKKDRLFGVGTADLKSASLTVFAVVSSFTVYFVSYWSNFVEGDDVGEQFFDFLSCVLLLVILLDLFRFRRAEQNQILLSSLLKQEQQQHELTRATIEVINRKCHDLKHQISALRHMSEADQERGIAELESAILLYDNLIKTGNEDLDIVLTEKIFLAEQKGIRLQCMIDGASFSFLRTEDLCSLFGNAIDNAIAATEKEPAPSKRIVTLHSTSRGNILTIHVENPCPTEPLFLDGLPQTTSPDKDFHGFGMRSMRYVAQQYGGVLHAGWEDGVFSLDILFVRG